MKALVKLAALAALVFFISQLLGRSVKHNVGQSLPKLEVKYIGDAPALAGKPMILEFWATWCGPCRESIPHLNDIYKQYQPKGLEIVGVTKEDAATVAAFTKEVPINYAVALDPNSTLSAHFGVTSIPHAMLVDKTGKIVWEGHPLDLKPADIEALLK
jgi:thiol-disulfide isomerase/thioredoxin